MNSSRLFYSNIPVSHDSVTARQHAQYQGLETEAAKRNPAIINCIIYTCAEPLKSYNGFNAFKAMNVKHNGRSLDL